MVVVGDDDVPSFHIGIEWVAVFVCLAIVARRRNLFLGLVAAVAIVAIARAAGLAEIPWPDGHQPRRASASISMSRLGSIRALTSTSVAAGRIVAEDLAVDRDDLGRARRCRSRTSACGRRPRGRNPPRRAPPR